MSLMFKNTFFLYIPCSLFPVPCCLKAIIFCLYSCIEMYPFFYPLKRGDLRPKFFGQKSGNYLEIFRHFMSVFSGSIEFDNCIKGFHITTFFEFGMRSKLEEREFFSKINSQVRNNTKEAIEQ